MDNTYDLLKQARELCESEKYSRALSIINKALSQNSPWPPLHRAKAQILLKMNKYQEALLVMTLICEREPEDSKNWRMKAYVILYGQNGPSEDDIITAREAVIESKNKLGKGDEISWKKLSSVCKKLYSLSHESSDLRLCESIKIPEKPPVLCSECGEVKNHQHSYCLNCGHKYE